MKRLLVLLVLSLAPFLKATPTEEDCVFKDLTVRFIGSSPKPTEENVNISCANSLEEIVYQQDFTVERIWFGGHKITELKESAIANLENVLEISLAGCGLRDIHPEAFRNLPKLKKLVLSYGFLTEIKYGVFNNMGATVLDEVDLAFNKLVIMDNDVFKGLTIRRLQINNNRFFFWDPRWFGGSYIEDIDASENDICYLGPNSLAFNEKPGKTPKRISFIDNFIDGIHEDAFKGTDYIEVLRLSGNRLETLDLESFKNANIRKLDIRSNPLTCVSPEIFNLIPITGLSFAETSFNCSCMETWSHWIKTNNKTYAIDFDDGDKKRCNVTI